MSGNTNCFAGRMGSAVRQKANPVVVGLDPRLANVPDSLRQSVHSSDNAAVAEVFRAFCFGVIDAVATLVPAVKPQSAFFERLGPAGGPVLADVIAYARQAGLIVVLDAKRGDIGSTALAYASAYLGIDSAWKADALTVNPYLGDDSLRPFVDTCREQGAGIFVLVKTSNPGGAMFQDAEVGEERLYERVGKLVEAMAVETAGDADYGAVGAVVGATYPEQLAKLRSTIPHAWFLVPGFGSQGGTARDVRDAFDANGLGAIINSSRAIIFAHEREPFREKFGVARWQDAVVAATREMIDQLRAETAAGRL